jgi:glutaredoxin-like protein NrdH
VTAPITVYTRPDCRPCKRVLARLLGAELEFEVVDLSEPVHAEALNYVTNVLKATSVPVIVTDTHDPIIGYQPEKMKSLIRDLTLNGDG